jgi:NTP pyrophosphatase (non-canonical NTP hydrolase)
MIADEQEYIDTIFAKATASMIKAKAKFPQPNYVALKIAEEAGEVVRAAVHYAEGRLDWDELEGEVVQTIAMLLRLLTEGDQINGVIPPHLK